MMIASKGKRIVRIQKPYMVVAATSAEQAVSMCPEWKEQTSAGLKASAVDCYEYTPGYWSVSIIYTEPASNPYAWLRMC